MLSETRVLLSSPLSYAAADGKMRPATFVMLRAPGSPAYRVALKIKQQLVRAIMAEQRRNPTAAKPAPTSALVPFDPDAAEEEEVRPAGADYLNMLAASDADLAELAEHFRELVLSHGVALVDGEVRMTPLLLDSLSMGDFESLLGEYLATFPLA